MKILATEPSPSFVQPPSSYRGRLLAAVLLLLAGTLPTARAQNIGTVTSLYDFTGGSDGSEPGGLVQGSDGNFYGTTAGETNNAGTVFRLTPAGALSTLHTFTGGSDGGYPSSLIQGSDGNFYGTASVSGSTGTIGGTVFRFSAAGELTTLHYLGGDNGFGPGGLVQSSDGNFYGVTYESSGDYRGTVFRVTPAGEFTTLHRFIGGDGYSPNSSLVQGSDGNFYGTTLYGGPTYQSNGQQGSGILYQITPAGQLSIIYAFDNDEDVGGPSRLIQGSDGSFYGATLFSDSLANGTIFKLTINPPPVFFAGAVALSDGVYYLAFSNGNYFGYYSYLSDAHYIYHQDLGYEYVFDAGDGQGGVYLYDFESGGFFYTSPSYPFPYLYDFGSNSVLYYFPDPDHAGRYNTGGVRYFYSFGAGQVISK